MTKTCWKCQKPVEGPFHFKSVCEYCHSFLHCCVGCQYYQVGKPNDCLIPGTEPVRDREMNNYCEDFKIQEGHKKIKNPSIDEISKKLFGDDG